MSKILINIPCNSTNFINVQDSVFALSNDTNQIMEKLKPSAAYDRRINSN